MYDVEAGGKLDGDSAATVISSATSIGKDVVSKPKTTMRKDGKGASKNSRKDGKEKAGAAKKRFDLTIEYRAEDARYQSEMPAPVTYSYRAKAGYCVLLPQLEGFKANVESVTGVMPKRDLTIPVTYSKTYKLTVICSFPTGAGDDVGLEPLRLVYTLADGEQYRLDVKELFTRDALSTGGMLETDEEALLASIEGWVPDKEVVEGTIDGADVTEAITFSLPQP